MVFWRPVARLNVISVTWCEHPPEEGIRRSGGWLRRLLRRHFRYVRGTPARITDIRLPRMTPPSAMSCRWRHANTSWNHGCKGIAENGRAGSHLVLMILQWPPKEKGPKGRRGHEFRVHTYPTVSSKPRGRRVQSLVQIGSEIWICISSIHTNKQTNIYLYI